MYKIYMIWWINRYALKGLNTINIYRGFMRYIYISTRMLYSISCVYRIRYRMYMPDYRIAHII